MRYFYDCEFLEDGRTVELISIGIVAEDGREYYAVNREAPWGRIRRNSWLMANVVPGLPRLHGDWRRLMPHRVIDIHDDAVRPYGDLAHEVAEFLRADGGQDRELWAYYGAYDHVVLCQLWGPMVMLPEGLPMFTHDIMQLAGGRDLPEQPDGVHNALADARHVKTMFEHLTSG